MSLHPSFGKRLLTTADRRSLFDSAGEDNATGGVRKIFHKRITNLWKKPMAIQVSTKRFSKYHLEEFYKRLRNKRQDKLLLRVVPLRFHN